MNEYITLNNGVKMPVIGYGVYLVNPSECAKCVKEAIEVGYRKTDLPVYLYSKVGSFFSDLNVAVTFRDSEINPKGEYYLSPFIIKASLVKESTIYKAKKNPELLQLSPSYLDLINNLWIKKQKLVNGKESW